MTSGAAFPTATAAAKPSRDRYLRAQEHQTCAEGEFLPGVVIPFVGKNVWCQWEKLGALASQMSSRTRQRGCKKIVAAVGNDVRGVCGVSRWNLKS